MTENKINSIEETEAGYGELFAVLIRRRFWLLSILCIAVAGATAKALREKPTYTSSMQLLVESNYQGKKTGKTENNLFADYNVEIDNATQLSLMQGSQLIQKAVKLLRPQYPEINVEEIKESLVVSQVADEKARTQTKIFEAIYTANNPIQAQKVLQTMQRVYLDYNREQQRLRLTKGLAFIDEQLPNVRAKVAEVEGNVEEFRKNQNLIEPEVQAKALTDAINTIQQERRANQASRKELQAQYESSQRQLASSPQEALFSARLSQSSRYQVLLNEIQKTDLAIAQQRIRFTDRNPVLQKLLSERNKQLSLLQAEGERTTPSVSGQILGTKESLLNERQLGPTDLTIATKLLDIETNLKGLSARDEALAKKEAQLRVELDQFPNLLAKYTRLQTEVLLKRETFQQLEKARQDLSLEIARGGFDWQVVEIPQPGKKSVSKKQQTIMLGVVVGMFLGVAVAFARDMLDDSIHSSDQLTKLVPLPLLGMTPQLPLAKKNKLMIHLPFGKRQVSASSATEPIIKLLFGKSEGLSPYTIEVIHSPPAWKSFDLIYKNIQLQNLGSTFSPLIITSALDGEGTSTISLGLAISAARLHQRVLLIDADFHQPMLHKQLNLPNDYGLSTLLESNATMPISNDISGSDLYLDILTSGSIPNDPVNLLSSPQMQRLMTGFEQAYDLVLVNAPPVLGMVDSLLLASCCRGVVLVTRIDLVTKTALTETTVMLNKLNAIGMIANGGISLKKGNIPSVKQ